MKIFFLFLIISLFLFTSSSFAGLNYAREKLKGTANTQNDFKNTSGNTVHRVTCECQNKDGKCYCECPCPACSATSTPAATTPTTKTYMGKGSAGGGGTSKYK